MVGLLAFLVMAVAPAACVTNGPDDTLAGLPPGDALPDTGVPPDGAGAARRWGWGQATGSSDAHTDGGDGAAPSDGGVASACGACAAGEACSPAGKCAPCTKACGANGVCALSWETGPHCQCAPGYYETLSGCAPVAGSPCAGITCGGHGTCYAAPPLFSPECHCEGDTVSYGLTCSPRKTIRCIDRDGTLKDKGAVRCSADDTTFEVCRDGDGDGAVEWVASGKPSCAAGPACSQCLETKCDNGDGTGGQACPTGTVCMGMVHETPVYRCQPSCDCTNCGTCDPGQFHGYQRACGSDADTFENPTIVCKSPCPHAGDGCLPYGQFAFCFPNEGCASAAPR